MAWCRMSPSMSMQMCKLSLTAAVVWLKRLRQTEDSHLTTQDRRRMEPSAPTSGMKFPKEIRLAEFRDAWAGTRR